MLHSSLLAVTALFLSATTSTIALPAAEADLAIDTTEAGEAHLFKRASPGPTDTTFINNVLNTVNPIRSKYKANPLAWDATLASLALMKSNGCKLNHTVGPRHPYFLSLFSCSSSYHTLLFSSPHPHLLTPFQVLLFLPSPFNIHHRTLSSSANQLRPQGPYGENAYWWWTIPATSTPNFATTITKVFSSWTSQTEIMAYQNGDLLGGGTLRRRRGRPARASGVRLVPTDACRTRTRTGGFTASFGRGAI